MFCCPSLRRFVGAVALVLAITLCSLSASAINLHHNFTMPAGIDPDKKIFFGFSGDSDTFTGNDLISGAAGVEFHVVSGSGLQVNQIVISLDSAVPDCLQPLTGQVTSLIDNAEFPTVSIPWQNVPPSPYPLTLASQPGAVLIGQPINSFFFGPGLAYGTLELTSLTISQILALDPECVDDFRALQFRATGFGFVVPEPGGTAGTLALLLTGAGVFRCVLRKKR